ncbi:NirD/YgiW/YdeI family stress tolerance protein [uncultured Endozoicomonas sp.]|uniref:NirD/YgiW/YdeI family stress tolerance protein n=1 Tax=uncultured Endozoicomonas sp. TaxID=432652 RepID=UPI002637A7F8|nr:NirD/YgiW/YdeI family stress tolerance protein [uncultured Endozoicomonas sp.]
MKKGYLLPILLTGVMTGACSQESADNPEIERLSYFSSLPAYQKYSVEEILSHSEDEELVKISGEIIQQIKDRIYLFRGETGDIKIVIEDSVMPEQGVMLKSPVQIRGEVDNPVDRAPRVEVDAIQYVF